MLRPKTSGQTRMSEYEGVCFMIGEGEDENMFFVRERKMEV